MSTPSGPNPIRISPAEYRILSELLRIGETYPFQLVKLSQHPLSERGIYTQLFRLELKGFVTSKRKRIAGATAFPYRRAYFQVNEAGERALQAWNAAAAEINRAPEGTTTGAPATIGSVVAAE